MQNFWDYWNYYEVGIEPVNIAFLTPLYLVHIAPVGVKIWGLSFRCIVPVIQFIHLKLTLGMKHLVYSSEHVCTLIKCLTDTEKVVRSGKTYLRGEWFASWQDADYPCKFFSVPASSCQDHTLNQARSACLYILSHLLFINHPAIWHCIQWKYDCNDLPFTFSCI